MTRDRADRKREAALAHLRLVPTRTLATPAARGYVECPCPKRCTLHGECELCVAYHARRGLPPRCER